MKLWKQKVELIAAGQSFSNNDFEIDFKVDFDTDPEPNVSEIKIYNLSNSTISNIKKEGNVILNAGYKGDIGTILLGTIEEIKGKWNGVDKETKLMVGEGSKQWYKTYIEKSYMPGITSQAVINDLANTFGLELGDLQLENNVTYSRGITVSGMLQNALRQVVKDTGSKFYISNGKIYIRPKKKGTFTGFLLNSDTGLVDTPQKIEQEGKEGYKVKMLLNHKINVDSILQIESRTANGNFRVVKGTHKGDFITEVEVVPL
ncbi:phage protein [Dethiothermospora halolimnae]|uniref:phage protein n=1 Tax=Dethiothermospora halolimnae TaxID=3114390 RepID=UPI003CCB8E27